MADAEQFTLDHEVAELLGVRRRWAAGVTLLHEGERTDHVLWLEVGRVKVSSSAPTGKQVVLAIRGPGDLLGEFSAIDGRARSATVTTISEVTALILSGPAFRRMLISDGKVTFELLRMVLKRVRESDAHRLEFGVLSTQERVNKLLLDYIEHYGRTARARSAVMISLPLSQTEMAQAVGASREAVTRALKHLRDLGVVRTARRQVEVLRPDLLQRLANGELDP